MRENQQSVSNQDVSVSSENDSANQGADDQSSTYRPQIPTFEYFFNDDKPSVIPNDTTNKVSDNNRVFRTSDEDGSTFINLLPLPSSDSKTELDDTELEKSNDKINSPERFLTNDKFNKHKKQKRQIKRLRIMLIALLVLIIVLLAIVVLQIVVIYRLNKNVCESSTINKNPHTTILPLVTRPRSVARSPNSNDNELFEPCDTQERRSFCANGGICSMVWILDFPEPQLKCDCAQTNYRGERCQEMDF